MLKCRVSWSFFPECLFQFVWGWPRNLCFLPHAREWFGSHFGLGCREIKRLPVITLQNKLGIRRDRDCRERCGASLWPGCKSSWGQTPGPGSELGLFLLYSNTNHTVLNDGPAGPLAAGDNVWSAWRVCSDRPGFCEGTVAQTRLGSPAVLGAPSFRSASLPQTPHG